MECIYINLPQYTSPSVSESKVLICELLSVDGLSSSSIMVGKVPTLALSKKRQNISLTNYAVKYSYICTNLP